MAGKESLLEMVRDGLKTGEITKAELTGILNEDTSVGHTAEAPTKKPAVTMLHEDTPAGHALGVVDVLFYLAGLVLFAALVAMVSQLGEQSVAGSILLLAAGFACWAGAYIFGKQTTQADTVKGMVNALILTGCLAVSSGGLLAASQVAGDSGDAASIYTFAIALAALGGVHLEFDRIFRHPIVVVLGLYLLIAAFPTAVTGLLSSSNPPADVWALLGIATGVLVGYSGVIVAKSAPGREYLKGGFLPVAGFIILGSAYGASLAGEAAVAWQVLLPLLIYGAFFYSVKRRSQNFLVTGSVFLALYLITMSFKYFSGLGVSFCLILSAVALLATAYLATDINKRYIKES